MINARTIRGWIWIHEKCAEQSLIIIDIDGTNNEIVNKKPFIHK